ncbi:MAG TPA: hypothetical protein VHZ33_13225 [Trebonia sp.]|nr:hypothetical protein [Trebonia sp.]
MSTTDATSATMPTAVSSRTRMADAARPAPLALGSSDPISPQTVTQAMTLITVVQTQPRRRCSSRTAPATAGSESVPGDPTPPG